MTVSGVFPSVTCNQVAVGARPSLQVQTAASAARGGGGGGHRHGHVLSRALRHTSEEEVSTHKKQSDEETQGLQLPGHVLIYKVL